MLADLLLCFIKPVILIKAIKLCKGNLMDKKTYLFLIFGYLFL